MFRIECFCEDKHLPAVLRALAGLARDVKPIPVANAAVAPDGELVATHGDIQDLFLDYAKKRKLQRINVAGMREFLTKIGASPTSSYYHIAKAMKAGVLIPDKATPNLKREYVVRGSQPALPAPKPGRK